ncbi:MAG: NAD-dependent succinate-semialdehyde dehydrogenase [Beijerinckiaceae bacterium]|jgi:succinate-semialdehyde dehydrogenase / glutarate-semialdehyde dehydrogenase|nr:NAD-dependent succinate-semialdehyde dehydrogenase [Beijerinckiaceae bacterium]
MADAAKVTTTNPATGEAGKSYPAHSLEDARKIAADARAAFLEWRSTSFEHRAARMRAAAALLRERRDAYAAIMTEEMGKTVDEGRAEIEKCATHCDYFAAEAATFLAREEIDIGGPRAFVAYNPIGIVLAVMPWNFPFWQAIRFAAPALMAGNGAVLKHASNVPGCALAIEEVFRDAGFPAALFRAVLLPSKEIEKLIESTDIAAVTLTGSVEAGRAVAAVAGRALKKTVLELGGSDAYLVLEDADVKAAAKVAAAARMVNGGQSCIAGKRFIVLPKIRKAFEQAFVEAMQAYRMGDPTQEGVKLGPLQSVKARDEIHAQVEKSVRGGARILLGGEIPDRPGAYYPATILTDVTPGQPAHDEEVFGPVAAIIEARDEEDAIRIANASEFGLGSAVLTSDLARGEAIAAERLEAGMSFVNANVKSDPKLPFGGVKNSGYGRECGRFGIHEFVNIKTVVVAK